MKQTFFIADLHLSPTSPDLNHKFLQALQTWQSKIDALYILGDLFDAWIGDDDSDPIIDEIIQKMHEFSQVTPLFIMHGNRDFLLGETFAKKTGAQILPDPHIANLYGLQYVLSHGDVMCTDDLEYQAFRAQARNPMWQQAILAKPLAERRVLAAQIRSMSETKKTEDGLSEISDVTEAGVQALINQLEQADLTAIIHGHTHRPNTHQHIVNGNSISRYVLQDWHGDVAGYLSINENGAIKHHLF